MSEVVWRPGPERIAGARLTAFAEHVDALSGGIRAPDYAGPWRWSVDQAPVFWSELVRHAGLRITPPDAVHLPGESLRDSRWFVGSRLNFAENLLAATDPDREVIVACDERGRRRAWTGTQLTAAVARFADGLRADGVGPGDRVAAFLPNTGEAVIGMLATASLGAVWTSCSPDFGLDGVIDRFGQVEPVALIACDGYHYGGKRIDTRERVERIAGKLPGLKRLVWVPFLDGPDGTPAGTRFDDYGRPDRPLAFHAVAFDDPLYILYSSGTTGVPKCIVHGVGGTLLQHTKELQLQSDIHPGDTLFFFTTCGWMMWNWLASGLVAGARLLLYDGSPQQPGIDALWRLAERERVSHFGTSPRFLAAMQDAGLAPGESCSLPALRTLLSTGSPLPPQAYDYVHEAIGADLQLASISGGTDIISCFALGNPWSPVRRGELQGPGLAMDVDVFDPRGEPLEGEPGELVCRNAFPSMPVAFWNDEGGERYDKAYFRRFPGVWHHGDFAQRRPSGGFVILGRSDATLNPGGVRIGTAEIYRVVEAVPGVLEAVAVGYRSGGDEHVLLFVRLADGAELDEPAIRRAVREQLTPRHVPARVIACPDIPRTISGKITEIAVRDLVHGGEVANADALANPESLAFFRELGKQPLL